MENKSSYHCNALTTDSLWSSVEELKSKFIFEVEHIHKGYKGRQYKIVHSGKLIFY